MMGLPRKKYLLFWLAGYGVNPYPRITRRHPAPPNTVPGSQPWEPHQVDGASPVPVQGEA